MGWREYALTAMVDLLTEHCEFPEANAEKLARTLIDLSDPEFGEENGDE